MLVPLHTIVSAGGADRDSQGQPACQEYSYNNNGAVHPCECVARPVIPGPCGCSMEGTRKVYYTSIRGTTVAVLHKPPDR